MPTETQNESMYIGDVHVPGVISVNESGGMDAPEKKTEKGFSYTSLVDAEPVQANIDAYVTPETYKKLADLRDADRPFRTKIGLADYGNCKLNDLSVDQDASQISHFFVTISITEVIEASSGTATLSIDPDDSTTMSGSSAHKDPTLVRSREEESDMEEESGGTDPVGDIQGWLGM